jgi:hypothetical protein
MALTIWKTPPAKPGAGPSDGGSLRIESSKRGWPMVDGKQNTPFGVYLPFDEARGF